MNQQPAVRIDRRGPVSVLTLDRPPVNAIDLDFVRQVDVCFAQLEEEEEVGALVLTGAGACFSAGLDLRLVPQYDGDQQREMVLGVNGMIRRLYSLPCPTVAAINGHAIAGGLCIALACDYRIGSDSPYELGLTEARAGIPFPAAPMVVVNAELSPAIARRLTLLARNVAPQEAMRDGILDELRAPQQLFERAMEVAQDLAEIPRDAYQRVKRQLRATAIRALDEIVQSGRDPMLDRWLAPGAAASSAKLLGRADRKSKT